MARSMITGAVGGPVGDHLLSLYRRLLDAFGPQDWWPGETPFEVCVGAILTQNTNWENVERAVSRLRNEGLLNPLSLHELPPAALAELIRSAGYYNIKAARLKSFITFLVEEFQGDLDAMFSLGREVLRPQLLDVKGIGPETADSILLYAGGLPTFVVDAYTMRALLRHDIISEDAGYEDVRSLFMDHLPEEVPLYNEFHALWVALGKNRCKRGRPQCTGCPLEGV
jgi:endonuclease-3 related protein